MVFAAAVTFGAATGSASWEYGEPQNEAGTSPVTAGADSSTALPVYFPAVLYPEFAGDSEDASRGIHPASADYSLDPGTNLPTDYPGLTLPTHIALPVSVVEAASVRVSQQGGSLTESEAIHVLEAAGWPTELIPAALRVSYGESRWSPSAVGDSGRSLGLFQLNGDTWSRYCGIPRDALFDALENAQCAYRVYLYDLGRGQAPWTQWSVKP